MKTLCRLLAVLALGACAFTTHAAEPAPAMPISEALKIAQGYLERNGAKPAIVALTLEKSALLSGTRHWYAKWSAPVLRDGKREIGLEIAMDGALTRIVGRGTP